ncbi:MAG: hypothetical protein LUF85_16155 [Bacteroides sp.]|nr:hypothetical protein [Bacteroides sp.]
MDNEIYSVSIVRLFSILQTCLGQTREEIRNILTRQGLPGWESVTDPLMHYSYIQCPTDTEALLKFSFDWNTRFDDETVCLKASLLIDIENSINPYLYHCFRHYQRIDMMRWVDLRMGDQIEFLFFEEGFVLSFTRVGKEKVQELCRRSDIYSEEEVYL